MTTVLREPAGDRLDAIERYVALTRVINACIVIACLLSIAGSVLGLYAGRRAPDLDTRAAIYGFGFWLASLSAGLVGFIAYLDRSECRW